MLNKGIYLYLFVNISILGGSTLFPQVPTMGAQWLSGRVLDSRPRGLGFEPHRRHCVVSLSKNINPSLVLVQPRKTRPFITERLLMGRKESNQTDKTSVYYALAFYGDNRMARTEWHETLTLNSEIFARILFSRRALEDIFAKLKIRD